MMCGVEVDKKQLFLCVCNLDFWY